MTSSTGGQDRKARLAAAKAAAAAKPERRRRRWIITGTATGVVALAAGVTALAVFGSGSSSGTPGATTTSASSLSPQTGPPPWAAPEPSQVPALVQSAGLPFLGAEMLAVHFHAHLDVIVNGSPVMVPMNLGVGVNGLSPLHTHDPTGIVHIESGETTQFTVGQFFTEWNVRLTSNCLGGLCADSGHKLAVFTNGKLDTGDPTAVLLGAHQEIAIEYGPRGHLPAPPASSAFPAGL